MVDKPMGILNLFTTMSALVAWLSVNKPGSQGVVEPHPLDTNVFIKISTLFPLSTKILKTAQKNNTPLSTLLVNGLVRGNYNHKLS